MHNSARPPNRPPNRLAHASSPYLLQHAHNPVDWHPWGEEAFDEARRRGVPIFLSIGYSTCYWCHVMERECFENEAIAEQLRRDFVSIKLDREERPDLDDLYMAALLVTRGSGGWPLSLFLEPTNLRPFWCGTYLPPVPSLGGRGMASFPQVLEGIAEAWRDRRTDVIAQSEAIAEAVRERLDAPRTPVAIGAGQISQAIQALLTMLDRVNGGFGSEVGGPKFPQPAYIEFLLDALPAAADDATRRGIEHALRLSLDKMAQGGLFDHLAGGFHRYSVDATWTVPHFEKMLYDNALLAIVYARASRALNDRWYATIARRTLDYVLREMAIDDKSNHADSAGRTAHTTASLRFASAQDAEVDGREGVNYLWTPDQIRAALPDASDAAFALEHFGLTQGHSADAHRTTPVGNFVDPHHPPAPGAPPTFVLTLAAREEEHDPQLQRVREHLRRARSLRNQPRRDDKQITEWNGMLIAALAIAARELHEPRYAHAAARAARSLREATAHAGELPRSVREGRFTHPAVLSDYAWAILASVEAARALDALTPLNRSGSKFDLDCGEIDAGLAFASDLADRAASLFSQSQSVSPDSADASTALPPRWFDARADATDLFARTLASYDGATPSGVGVMLHALLELANLHPDAAIRERSTRRALDLLATLSPLIADSPIAVINATRSLLRLLLSGGHVARSLRERLPARSAPHDSLHPTSPTAHAGPDAFTPVEIFAEVDRVTVTSDSPAVFRLFIRIAPGYHIVAAEPHATPPPPTSERRPDLMPLRVGLIPGSGSGIRVYADYPPGQPYALGPTTPTPTTSPTSGDTILVHEGQIEFDVVIERTPSAPSSPSQIQGRPILGITLQACTHTECLLPRTYELDIAVDEG